MVNIKRGTLASAHLDLARGLAALLVLIGHVRAILFVNLQDVAERNVVVDCIYFVTGFGHQCVMIFFVLSGLFIASSVLRALREERWSWRWFLQQRLTRLYLVYVPALVLAAMWDHLVSPRHPG